MFGTTKAASRKQGCTVLILDIESGSVANALVSLAKTEPHILSFQRQHLPLSQDRSGGGITRSLEQALPQTLRHAAEVAARMRVAAPKEEAGQVAKAVVFLASPWGMPDLAAGTPKYLSGIRQYIKETIQAVFGPIPVFFYTSSDALLFGSRALGLHPDTMTVSLRGELLEMLLLSEGGPRGFSTMPLGSRSVLRTLRSHGGLSEHEARSILSLSKHTDDALYEPLVAAGRHLSDVFAEGSELLLPAGAATNIVVLGEQPLGEWFAKNIADNPRVSSLFSEDSTVEALLPYRLEGRVEHGTVHDPFVLLEALFLKGVY